MSRMLQKIPEDFQRFALVLGFSTRHARDMERKRITAQEISDLALVQSELERLGVFRRHPWIDSHAAAEREARLAALGLTFWSRRSKNPRHRPPSIDTPLLADKIAQAVLFERGMNPKKRMKAIVNEVGSRYGVERAYVYRCVRKVAPERRKQMVESIIKIVFFGEALALTQILAAPPS